MKLMQTFREPLVHFLVLGAGIFLISGLLRNPAADKPDRIVVTAGHIEQIVEGWSRTWQRPPAPQELEGLIEDYIREEVFYREALVLGLDRDDTIIRRRLRQKMEFLSEDMAGVAEPTDEELQTFLESHPDTFRIDTKVTFSHIYFNQDRRGETIRNDAEHLRAKLVKGNNEVDRNELGDPFPLPHDFEMLPEDEVTKLFGHEFAVQLLKLEPNTWTGPVESGYGIHLVFVRERIDGRMPELSEVREAVQREWFAAQRSKAKETFYRQLRDRYTVSVELPERLVGVVQIREAQ